MSAALNKSALRLVVVDGDRRTRIYIERTLSDDGVRIIGEAEDIKTGMRLIRGLQPDVVLIELPANASETVEAVQKIREELPDTGIIISSFESSPQLILSCVRAGAQEFVSRPIDVTELQRALEHVRKLSERTVAVSGGRQRGKALAVFAGKGGVGTTSFVANLGVALAAHSGMKTALVDLSFQMGDLGLMLDQAPAYSLMDAMADGSIDESKLRSVMAQHSSGVNVLTVAPGPDVAEEITRQHMGALITTLTNMYDYVIIDIGRHLDDRTVEVMDLADGVLLLSAQDVPTIRNTSRYLSMLEQLEIEREKVHLVVNRFQKKNRLTLRDVEAALDLEMFWTIPNDYNPVSLGIDGGVPAVLEAPRSKVAQSYKDLAACLCDMHGNHATSESVGATSG